jgi:hydroxyacylglutathione hydrolase
MKIYMNTGGLVATNGYLVADETSSQAAIVDSPHNTIAPLLSIARHNHWNIIYLLFTHGHWDHIGDHRLVTDAHPAAKVLIHALDEPKLIHPISIFMPLPYRIEARKADGYLEDRQIINIGKLQFQVLHTPGHSPGHVVFHCASENLLLAGDLLFAGSVGRTDLPDSDPDAMTRSLKRISTLPDQTAVHSGHGPATTIGAEKQENPFLLELGAV